MIARLVYIANQTGTKASSAKLSNIYLRPWTVVEFCRTAAVPLLSQRIFFLFFVISRKRSSLRLICVEVGGGCARFAVEGNKTSFRIYAPPKRIVRELKLCNDLFWHTEKPLLERSVDYEASSIFLRWTIFCDGNAKHIRVGRMSYEIVLKRLCASKAKFTEHSTQRNFPILVGRYQIPTIHTKNPHACTYVAYAYVCVCM